MQVKDDMRAIRDEYAVRGVEAFLSCVFEFFEEGGDVDDTTASNQIPACRVHKAADQDVEVISDIVGNDGLSMLAREFE